MQQALALRPAVIVMDVNMPRLDGLSAARQLKQDARTSSVPVILSTSQPLREQALKAGCAFNQRRPTGAAAAPARQGTAPASVTGARPVR